MANMESPEQSGESLTPLERIRKAKEALDGLKNVAEATEIAGKLELATRFAERYPESELARRISQTFDPERMEGDSWYSESNLRSLSTSANDWLKWAEEEIGPEKMEKLTRGE